jgi:long-subunit fatty acid transport protein
VVANVAARIGARVSVGGGLSVSQSQSGLYRFGLDVPDRTVTVQEEQVDATFSPSFNLGIAVQAAEGVRVGLTWRGAQSQHTDVPTQFDLQGLGSLLIQTAGTTLYWPHTFSLAAEWRTGALRLCGQADVQLWSSAPSEELQFAILPTGQVLTDTGLADLLGYDSPPRPAGFHSVVIPRVAAEWSLRGVTLRGGLAYRPAVTPDQSALSSYLDNATLQIGAGAAMPVAAGVSVEAAVGGALLFERTMHKASATNPTGDASFGGSLWSFSAMVHYDY